jgi:hypothetical protein
VEDVKVNVFLPRTLTVSVGDTVMWRLLGFHTATFLGNNRPPDLFVPGPGPGEWSAGPALFPIPLPPAPGPATYDGSGVRSSGPPLEEAGAEPPPLFTPRGLRSHGLPLLVAMVDVAGPVGGTTLPRVEGGEVVP